MGKFDGLLLVSDFDDTLYDSHHRVPERNLKALDYFLQTGWPLHRGHWKSPQDLRPPRPSGPDRRPRGAVQRAPPCTTFTRAGC